MKPNNSLRMVPIAVPAMPIPKVNVNSGTSATLSTAPVIIPTMAETALP